MALRGNKTVLGRHSVSGHLISHCIWNDRNLSKASPKLDKAQNEREVPPRKCEVLSTQPECVVGVLCFQTQRQIY